MKRALPLPLSTLPLFSCSVLLFSAAALTSEAQLLWTVGRNDNGWPVGDGGGPDTTFVQEAGINGLPGRADNAEADGQSDDDYYFAGDYSTVIDSVVAAYGDYSPIGLVEVNEESAERAFAGTDNTKRYHFNLPDGMQPTDLMSVSFDALNLDTGVNNSDPRYGIEIYFNGVLVQPEILIRPAQFNKTYTTPQFSLASVNAQAGAGFDNIVTLKGISYSGDGGGAWMGIDYVQLDQATEPVPQPVFPWEVGKDDNGWPVGDGGGANATFVQEAGVNALPGRPDSPEIDGQADDDYYFAGLYTTVIAGNGAYEPVGLVPVNEEAAERAFAGDDNDLRYHFNLPNHLRPSDQMEVSFDAFNLDTRAELADARYGVEVYFNGVLVQPQIVVRPAQLGKKFTTPPFNLSDVKAEVGSGYDNIVTLKGINLTAEGGGAWMGIDYVQLNPVATPIPPPVIPWSVGLDDDAWPVGDGGAENTTFVQENGTVNPLPGSPTSPEVDQQADNDYYFAGSYSTLVAGNGTYEPVGPVPVNEEAAERAFAGADNDLRYHFNLPISLKPTDKLAVSFDASNLQTDAPDPRYGVEVYFNGVKVQSEILIRSAQLGVDYTTPEFTLASVNAQVGPGYDNIITLKGINYNADGGGNWMGIDYLKLNAIPTSTFPWAVGRDDDGWPSGNGGGPAATFVQEAGINPLPGNPNNAEVDQQADDDYYFAGIYTTVIESNGAYEPVGYVLANEDAAERAFAGTDNDKRYHFNLPANLGPDDLLAVTFDANNLDGSGASPRYGVEIYFNGVKVQDEIIISTPELGKEFTTTPFTLSSVNAQPGPGFDNIVTLKGISYSGDGGGAWMGIDYVQLSTVNSSPFPWTVGTDDDGWPEGDGGGANATFVQEAGTNPLPGSWTSPELAGRADDDYYFAGNYVTIVEGNGDYEPVGLVPSNEEAAERAFAGTDNDLRYHFNLPSSLKPDDLLTVTFDALNLDTSAGLSDPRYGVELYFNGNLIQSEILIRSTELGVDYTTAPFTLSSVNAQVGPGYDNVVHLKGISYSGDGGGNWMGIDYVALAPVPLKFLPPSIDNGKISLGWTGSGQLESAPSVLGPWTPVTPAPVQAYVENLAPGQNRFFRLVKP
jgi:hypothetical protein